MSSAHGAGRLPERRVPRLVAAFGAVLALTLGVGRALADQYEATVSIRPIGGMGRFTETVTGDDRGTTMAVYGAGGVFSASYGVRNWLDVGLELAAIAFATASYDQAQVTVL